MPTQTFPVSGPVTLQARLGRGSVTVEAVAGLAEASVTLTPRRAESDIVDRVQTQFDGNTLTINAPREGGVFDMIFAGNRGRTALDAVIHLPAGSGVRLATVSGEVTVRGAVADLDLASGSAQIDVERVDGDLRLRYGSGQCRVRRVGGSVTSRSGSGTARFERIEGTLNAVCGSGELTVSSIGGAVRSRAGSGRFTLAAVGSDVDVASGSGPLRIGLPAGRPAQLDVTTGSGRVESELTIRDRPAVSTAKAAPIRVRARTGSGDIHLFRAGTDTATG